MKLSPKKILARFEDENLKLALVGMSNIGKSFTAKRLSEAFDFDLVDIDKNIQKVLGQNSMADFAAWQGQPHSAGYAEREAQSIRLETDVMLTAMEHADGNVILDTAGSVIYTGDEALKILKRDFFTVHIEASEADIKRLQAIYYEHPKPLIWADHYTPEPSRSDAENIAACYPNLLKARAERYRELADLTLDSRFILENDAKAIFAALTRD